MKIAAEFSISCLLLCILAQSSCAYKEIIGILDQAKDITHEERNTLLPLFNNLQSQYDYIISEARQDGSTPTDKQLLALHESTRHEFEEQFAGLLLKQSKHTVSVYDTSLPTVEELFGVGITDDATKPSMTQEDLNERLDLQSLLQESLDAAQMSINEIVKRALQLESNLLKINKPKLVEIIYDALSLVFQVAVRASRAAYCTYSHIPQLNAALHNIYDGIDCYTYVTGLVVHVKVETVTTVGTIRKNIFDLANVYKKIAAKHSIVGKISTLILNLTKISRDIAESYAVGIKAMDRLQNELPAAANESLTCGTNFVVSLPQLVETTANVTACITYVDDQTEDYDFMRPEAEREDRHNKLQ